MSRFDGENTTRSSEVVLLQYTGCGTKICRYTDSCPEHLVSTSPLPHQRTGKQKSYHTFQNTRNHRKPFRITDREPIRTLRHGRHPSRLQRLGQEIHMRRLISSNDLQIIIEWVGEASSDEVRLGIVDEALAVEGRFEVLEREGVVEDIAVCGTGGTLGVGDRGGQGRGQDGEKGGRFHVE